MIIDLEYETFSNLFHCDVRTIQCNDYARALTYNLVQYSNAIERLFDTRLYVRDYFSQLVTLLPEHLLLADIIAEHANEIIVPDIIYASSKALPGLSILRDIFPFVEYKLFDSIDEMEEEVLRVNELGSKSPGNNLSDRIVVHTPGSIAVCTGYATK